MLRDSRVLFFHASAFQDLSAALSDSHAQSKVLAFTSGDFLYLGSVLPFNHRYFDVKVENDQDAVVSVDIWGGASWIPAVDIVDETADSAGKSLAQSGIISWQPDLDNQGWNFGDTLRMVDSGLEDGPKIFGFFWARVKWSATLNALTELNYVGHKFSADEALFAEYPDLADSNMQNAFAAGKTDWKEQTLMAAEYIVQDLRGRRNLISSPDQILAWDLFEKASIHRTAMIVYKAFGKDYQEAFKSAADAYKSAMEVGGDHIDRNANANQEDEERTHTVTFMTR
jgi:hypothetical protein